MVARWALIASLSALILATACGGGQTPPSPTPIVRPTLVPSATPSNVANSDDALAHFEAGVALQAQGNLAGAIAEYGEAILLNPLDASAFYINRGGIYRNLGQHQRAIEDYDQAIRLDPQDASAFYIRGNVYYGLGKYQRAIQDYDEAIRLDPQFVFAYLTRGLAHRELDQHIQAVEDYDEAINLAPEFTHAFIARALAHTALGNDEEAQQDVNRAVEFGAIRGRLEDDIEELKKQR